MKKIFESKRISFVEVSELLVDDYLIMVNDYENVNRFINGKHKAFTAEQELQWVRTKREEEALVFSMIEKKSGSYIGNIELMDTVDAECELGIAITAEMQNLGFGTEAVMAATEYGFDRAGLRRIFLRVKPDNERAVRVYRKSGFREYLRTEEFLYMEMIR